MREPANTVFSKHYTSKHCFLAMFPDGGQTNQETLVPRKHCIPKGGYTSKHCFLTMFPDGGQTNQETLFPSQLSRRWTDQTTLFPRYISQKWTNQKTLFPSHVSRRWTNQKTLFPQGEQTRKLSVFLYIFSKDGQTTWPCRVWRY